jgi:hypothetical protein
VRAGDHGDDVESSSYEYAMRRCSDAAMRTPTNVGAALMAHTGRSVPLFLASYFSVVFYYIPDICLFVGVMLQALI